MAQRAKTILLYSESGNGKTSQLVYIARYIHKKYGKITRLASSDGGGWAPVEDEGLLYNPKTNPNGIVHGFNMTNRKHLLADWRKLSKGDWPRIVLNEQGQKVRMITRTPDDEMSKVGAYFCEGLTSIATGFLSHISKQDNSSDTTKVLFKGVTYEEDGEIFGATDKGHVGLVQRETFNLTQQFATLPVELMVFTALVSPAEERITGKPIYGPKLAGNALTPEAPSWFSDCLHLHAKSERRENEEGIVVEDKTILGFYQRHEDEETSKVYLAKSSTGPSVYQKLKERYPGGYFVVGFEKGVAEYLEFLDEVKHGREKV